MKNKCLQLFLVLSCLMLVFGLAKISKAEIVLNSASSTNFTGTGINIDIEIPDSTTCSDPLLIVNMANDGDKFIGSATYDSVDMEYANYQSEKGGNYAYILSPNVGNNNLYISVPDGGWKNLVWSVFCGVDSLATSTVQGGWGTYYSPEITNVNIETDGSLMFSFLSGRQSGGDYALTPKFSDTLIDIAYNTQITGSSYGLRDIGTRSVGWNTTNFSPYLIWGYLVFNPAITEFCGDTICNGDETTVTCSDDCPASNGYSNIITLLYNPVEHPLLPDALDVFYYSYNTSLISNTYFGGLAYVEIERCLNVGCSTTTPYFFTDSTGATSTKSYILGKGINIASSTNTVGRSLFTIANESWRISSTTREVYKIIPTYYNINTSEMTTGNPTAQVVNWVAYGEQPALPVCVDKTFDGSTLCDIYDLEALTGQILCGFTYGTGQALFWLFNPTCDGLDYIVNGYNNFKSAFPFNAYYDLVDAIDVAITSTSTSSTSTIGIPFIDTEATGTNKYYIMPVLTTSSIPNAIGQTNADIFRTTIGYLIWIIVAWIIYIIISKI